MQEHFHNYVTDRRTCEEDTTLGDEELTPQKPSVVNRALKETAALFWQDQPPGWRAKSRSSAVKSRRREASNC